MTGCSGGRSAATAARPPAAPAASVTPNPPAVSPGCLVRAAQILHIRTPAGGYLHWGSDPFLSVRFGRNSAEIPGEYEDDLVFLVDMARARPPATFTVEGHRVTSEQDSIAKRRAEAVRDRLVSMGVEPASIEIEVYGDSRPIANPKTEQGQKANARADIRLDLTWPPIPEDFIRQACGAGIQ